MQSFVRLLFYFWANLLIVFCLPSPAVLFRCQANFIQFWFDCVRYTCVCIEQLPIGIEFLWNSFYFAYFLSCENLFHSFTRGKCQIRKKLNWKRSKILRVEHKVNIPPVESERDQRYASKHLDKKKNEILSAIFPELSFDIWTIKGMNTSISNWFRSYFVCKAWIWKLFSVSKKNL